MSVTLTHHAIDRASTRFGKLWRQTRESTEQGLASWLLARIDVAIRDGRRKRFRDGSLAVSHDDISYIFRYEGNSLVLLTVYSGDPKPEFQDHTPLLIDQEDAA